MHRTRLELVTTRQAADRLGRSIRYVLRLVDADQLTPVAKLPGLRGAYLFAPEDIESLARGNDS